jgi:hypothetical protein
MLAAYMPWLLSASGVLGVVLGVNRTLKRREDESKLLQVISFLAGALLFAAPVAMVLQSGQSSEVSGVSILLALLLAICLVSRALKDLPFAFIVVTVAGTGLFGLFSYIRQFSFAGDIPTQTIALAIAVLIVVVFGISFFIEKIIDLFLGLLSLGLIVFIVSAAALIQGLLTGLHITDQHGLLNLIIR